MLFAESAGMSADSELGAVVVVAAACSADPDVTSCGAAGGVAADGRAGWSLDSDAD